VSSKSSLRRIMSDFGNHCYLKSASASKSPTFSLRRRILKLKIANTTLKKMGNTAAVRFPNIKDTTAHTASTRLSTTQIACTIVSNQRLLFPEELDRLEILLRFFTFLPL